MCLGVPGRVIEWLDQDPLFARAVVEFSGIKKECQMACVPDAKRGDYVVVHAGIAISLIDESAAEKALRELQTAGLEPTEQSSALRIEGNESTSTSDLQNAGQGHRINAPSDRAVKR